MQRASIRRVNVDRLSIRCQAPVGVWLGQSGRMNAIGPVDWPALQRRMDQGPRSLAWRQAGRWALSSVERHLGQDWLAKHAKRGLPLPAELTRAGSDVEALSHLLDLGLGTVQRCPVGCFSPARAAPRSPQVKGRPGLLLGNLLAQDRRSACPAVLSVAGRSSGLVVTPARPLRPSIFQA